MTRTRLAVLPIAVALIVAWAFAVYPADERAASAFWLFVDLALLLLATHGRRWALNVLAYTSSVGAALFVLAGAGELASDPRSFLRGVALAVAAALLIRARRPAQVEK